MNQPTCARLWQVEASLDGRLDAAEAASFARHLVGCAACTGEMAELRALAETMSALPEGRQPELSQRRARQALLKAADERALGHAARPAWRLPALGLAAAACAAGLWLGAGRGKAPPAPPSLAFEVRDEGSARWTEETHGASRRVVLRDGKAGFHAPPGRAEVVAVPDGELVARGARFTVVVAGGKTRAVVVTEGSVSVSVAGYLGEIGAGGRWSLDEPGASLPAPEPSGLAGSGGARPALPAESARRPAPAPPSSASANPVLTSPELAPSAAPAPSASAEPAPPTAGARFAEAMAAFSSGQYARADALFAAFVRDFPRDGRAEDATFLRIESRVRRGDAAAARAAASDYLRAYPRGLRRPEAARIAGGEGR